MPTCGLVPEETSVERDKLQAEQEGPESTVVVRKRPNDPGKRCCFGEAINSRFGESRPHHGIVDCIAARVGVLLPKGRAEFGREPLPVRLGAQLPEGCAICNLALWRTVHPVLEDFPAREIVRVAVL